MMRAGLMVFSALFWAFLVSTSALLYLVALVLWAVTAPFDRRRAILHHFTCLWASIYTWVNPCWSVRVEGREKIDRKATYVMVANHNSLVDILVLFRLFVHFKWVSKIENFKLPFIGWNMYLNRYIQLERGNRQSVIKMLRACRQTLAEGSSVMIFPEGTRSPTGRMRSFKPGAFELAKSTGTPILPIALHRTFDALPKHGLTLTGRHRMMIQVLDPIPPEDFADAPVDDLAERVRKLILAALEQPTGS